MKKIIIFLAISCLIINTLQAQSFNETTFNGMMARLQTDKAFFKNEADPSFTIIFGNGAINSREDMVKFAENNVGLYKRIESNLKVRQVGNSAIATGTVEESFLSKTNPGVVSWSDKEIYTYTFSQVNGKWLWVSAQHTDYKAPVADDEAAIKNVIIKETYSITKARNSNDFMSCYATKDVMFGPYKGKILNGVGELRTEAEKVVKEFPNPTPNTIVHSDWKIKINGNSAFATCLETTTTPENKETFANKSDYLEKINGEWKMVDHRFYRLTENVTSEQDEAAIKSMLNAETTAFDNADYKTYLGYYSKANYTSFLYSAGLFVGDDLWKQLDNVFTTRKAQKIKRIRTNWNIRINGASAFITYNQANEFADTNSKSETYEERYLEKMSGEWKIVNTTVITKK